MDLESTTPYQAKIKEKEFTPSTVFTMSGTRSTTCPQGIGNLRKVLSRRARKVRESTLNSRSCTRVFLMVPRLNLTMALLYRLRIKRARAIASASPFSFLTATTAPMRSGNVSRGLLDRSGRMRAPAMGGDHLIGTWTLLEVSAGYEMMMIIMMMMGDQKMEIRPWTCRSRSRLRRRHRSLASRTWTRSRRLRTIWSGIRHSRLLLPLGRN